MGIQGLAFILVKFHHSADRYPCHLCVSQSGDWFVLEPPVYLMIDRATWLPVKVTDNWANRLLFVHCLQPGSNQGKGRMETVTILLIPGTYIVFRCSCLTQFFSHTPWLDVVALPVVLVGAQGTLRSMIAWLTLKYLVLDILSRCRSPRKMIFCMLDFLHSCLASFQQADWVSRSVFKIRVNTDALQRSSFEDAHFLPTTHHWPVTIKTRNNQHTHKPTHTHTHTLVLHCVFSHLKICPMFKEVKNIMYPNLTSIH